MIRRARAADASALAALQVRSWHFAYGAYVDAAAIDEAARDRHGRWREILAGEHGTFVAERDGVLLGFVSVGASRDEDAPPEEGELWALYVDPHVVGTGVGAALMAFGEAELARSHPVASLWVFERNERARRFYERGGWRIDERRFRPDRWGWARSVRYVKRFGAAGAAGDEAA